MLATGTHIGTKNLEPSMERYIWKRRQDGMYIIDLQKTWEKLVLAARIIVAIENPQDICVISARPYGMRAVLKFAKYIGAHAIAGRYTPGGFTNQIQEKFLEPRLLILTDPITDHQPIREAAYVNIPTIAFAHTDCPLRLVDVAIPCNNKGKHAIGLMWWMLAREVLYLRGQITRPQPWNVMVDLFFYGEPEEEKEEVAEESFKLISSEQVDTGAPSEDWQGQTGEWGQEGADWGNAPTTGAAPQGQEWDPTAVPSRTWD